MMRYKVVGAAAAQRASDRLCDICGEPVKEKIDKAAVEVMCHRCLMGLADAYDGKRAFSQEELVKAIRDRELERFRVKFGLSQGDLSHLLGISTRQCRRYEKGKFIPIDNLINEVEKNTAMSALASTTIKT